LALVVDTGPLFAAYDRSDADHERCVRLLASTREELVLPAPVVIEFDWLTNPKARNVPEATPILLADITAGAYKVIALTVEDYVRCGTLLRRYADSDIGFVDAAILAVVERLKEPKLATLDWKHFGFLRPSHVAALQLLPD
jgi:hypothetical protein